MISPLIDQLIKSFSCLPGVGPKSAQRMALHLLERDRDRGKQLAKVLLESLDKVDNCTECRTFCETKVCKVCSNPARDKSLLCIVETPADFLAIEQTGGFKGVYFVLMGRLSPIDGIGPKVLGIDKLQEKLASKVINEVIIATNTTVEGEATAYYIAELTRNCGITTSRIAHGVPLGGELEYLDGGTLARALQQRLTMDVE